MDGSVLDVYGLTDVGRKRETNEDQFVVALMRNSLELEHSTSSASRPRGC
jgi:hypothetical protein